MSGALFLLLVASPPFSAAGSSGPEWPRLEGRWAFVQVTAAVSDAPLIGEVTSETRAVGLLDVEQRGAALHMREELCLLETSSPNPVVSTEYPKAFLQALSGGTREARLVRDRRGGLHYVQPKNWEAPGLTLSDVPGEPLPEEPADPRVDDTDRDGHPGLTVRINGLVSGDIRVVSRGWTAIRGRVVSPDRIEGRVRWATEQRILETTNSLLSHQPNPSPHPDPRRSWFRMVRLPSDAGCPTAEARSEG